MNEWPESHACLDFDEHGPPNLDGSWPDDLREYADRCYAFIRANLLKPDTEPVPFLLAEYAKTKATAMEYRTAGNIQWALCYEGICDSTYRQLPKWARW